MNKLLFKILFVFLVTPLFGYYVPPSKECKSSTFFQELLELSNKEDANFDSILVEFESHIPFFHQIHFQYPLESKKQAELFAKVLQIKARQAHKFVPVMKLCEVVEPCHLGFIRRVDFDGKGFSVQDRVVIDKNSDTILFIQEWAIDAAGKKNPGNFAAVNKVCEQDGKWYFVGTYLYPSKPSEDALQGIMHTFQETFTNMLLFSKITNCFSTTEHTESTKRK